MIESIKSMIWGVLKEKDVSLAMIYDCEGRVLWSKGRPIIGKTIENGEGFSKSFICKTLVERTVVDERDVLMTVSQGGLSKSARNLKVKSLMILPIEGGYYLYLDSGTKHGFQEKDYEILKVMGKMLGESIELIRKSEADVGGITGNSEQIRQMRELVLKFSLEEDPVLLLGETGVGKTHVAELIHNYSGRKGKFVVVDTTTIHENLFESEVFGHRSGAFTGAIADKRGLIDEAIGGTLFFDEVAEVPVSFQAKLLRFIEARKYRVVGETREQEADVRIVAATSKDLQQAMRDGEFRDALYFRLNVLCITIPPLRMRRADVRDAVRENLRMLKGKEIGDGFWEAMDSYDWPGNYRELFSVLKRAGILCDSPIGGGDVKRIIQESLAGVEAVRQQERAEETWGQLRDGRDFWVAVKEPFLARDLNRAEVKAIISRALIEVGGRYVDALEIFNLERDEYKKFMRFLHKHRLQ